VLISLGRDVNPVVLSSIHHTIDLWDFRNILWMGWNSLAKDTTPLSYIYEVTVTLVVGI